VTAKKDSTKENNKEKNDPYEGISTFARAIIAALFFIAGFNFSYSAFFRDNPLYGINYLAETLISATAALAGFYMIPRLFLQMKAWFEHLIVKTISDLASRFWDEQSQRMSDRKKEREKQKAKEEKKKLEEQLEDSVLVDTSVLIDGRILGIVESGFFDKTLVVPSAVMNELHLISDSEDKLKRERGRRGLDMVKKLKGKTKVFMPDMKSKEKGVDKKLLEFAKEHKVRLMTQDFNLNKLAQASGVKVLNINRLVEAVKVSVLPGETFEIEITHEGKEKTQGVGYMPDGTMVVVEGAKGKIHKMVKVKVTRVIQSQAGKIIFGKLA
jgi:uncharacterized protein YacL